MAATRQAFLAWVFRCANFRWEYEGVPWRTIQLALPVISAIVDAHNAAAAHAYEQYRVACEQGVALPPSP